MLGVGPWEDPFLGTGGKYGFGWDVRGGYAFGVTNQGPRVSSFYDPNVFGGEDVPNQYVPDQNETTIVQQQTQQSQGGTPLMTTQETTSNQQPAQSSSWLLALVIAVIIWSK